MQYMFQFCNVSYTISDIPDAGNNYCNSHLNIMNKRANWMECPMKIVTDGTLFAVKE